MEKKGQVPGAGAIATFVLLIMLFIIVYMVLIPSEERDKILGTENATSEKEESVTEDNVQFLFATSPGKVLSLSKEDVKKDLAAVALFSRTESEIIELANTLKVERNLFKDNYKDLYFNLDDLGDIEKASLIFLVKEGSGNLKISLNNIEMFNDRPEESAIVLPKSYLKKENKIRLSVDFSVGTNYYSLSDINIKTERKVENKKAERTFVLTDSEKSGLKQATLNYFINCVSLEKRGTLNVKLNGYLLSSDYVICDIGEISVDLPKGKIISGVNTINFEIDKGDYRLDNVELNMGLSERYYPVYNFEVVKEDLDDNVYITLKFTGDKRKKAAITINDKQINFDTNEREFEKDITGFLNIGANYIKIIPRVDFEIESLKVVRGKI